MNASEKLSELFGRYPLLRAISSTVGEPATARAFFRSPELGKVRELNLESSIIRFMMDLENENLANLRYVSLQHLGGPHDLDGLSGAPWFPNLEALVLYSFSLDAKNTTTLGARLPLLRELQIVDSRMGRDAASALVGSGALAHVRTLALRHARLSEGDATLFAQQKDWRPLSALDLRTNRLGARDAGVIAERFPGLRVLDLGNNPTFGSEGIRALGALTRLRSLGLQKTGLDDTSLRGLAPLMKSLRVLDLRKNALTDQGITELVHATASDAKHLSVLFVGTQASSRTKKALRETLPDTRIY